jgi:DnaJ homolog subfamily C member 7
VTAIEADPNSSTYYSNRAAAYMSANRFFEALEDVKRADELEPHSPKILHRLARVYTSIGRPREAIQVYESLQPPASSKDMAPAISMLQHVTQAESQLKEGTSGSMTLHALDQASRGLGKGIDEPRKWRLMRGEAYLRMGNPNSLGEALNVAVTLLRVNNQDPEALVLRGRVMYAQGDNDKAIVQFKAALNCDPDYRDAVKYLRMVQKLDRLKKEGNSHFSSGRLQDAIKNYTEALEIDASNKPTNAKLFYNRALCYVKVCHQIHVPRSSSLFFLRC